MKKKLEKKVVIIRVPVIRRQSSPPESESLVGAETPGTKC